MAIRAARIEVNETPDGYYVAKAFGSPGQHAVFRQKRDAPDEWIEGDAERLEYDGKSDVIRFITNATVKRLRGSTSADEITGNLVTYDSATEIFSVSGGAAPTVANPSGRVRAVLMPREGTPAAAEATAAAASAAAAAASAPPLRTTPALGVVK
jgi:lipopolysaccharide export system protein LptA